MARALALVRSSARLFFRVRKDKVRVGFFAAKPKEDVIDKLKKEKDWYLDKIIRIDSVMSNDTNISDKQLYLMDKQSTAMDEVCKIIDKRIKDLKTN